MRNSPVGEVLWGVDAPARAEFAALEPLARAQAEREQISIVAGSKDDDFVRNMVTLLAKARGAVMVRDRQHVAYGNILA